MLFLEVEHTPRHTSCPVDFKVFLSSYLEKLDPAMHVSACESLPPPTHRKIRPTTVKNIEKKRSLWQQTC